MKFIGIIPARYASSRFPGKPLADIGGKPMIQRVYEQVSAVLEEVYVATDDVRIYEAVRAFGGRVLMTADTHRSGTDRCAEAMTKVPSQDFDVVINIQGDEPFVEASQIISLMACFDEEDTQIATLVKPFSAKDDFSVLANPNSPKVVLNKKGEAQYFSRSIVPYLRSVPQEEWLQKHVFYKHIGIYAYRKDVLIGLAALAPTPLEKAESLEQLRWIENNYRIRTAVTLVENVAVDTPEDLALCLTELARRK